MKNFYSIKEAADYLEVDYKVVYRLVREGKIPSARVGWQYRMTQEDLNAYLNVQRAKQSSASSPAVAASVAKGQGRRKASNGNGARSAASGAPRSQARLMEQNVHNRFRQKVHGVAAIQHPTTQEMLYVEDWEAICHESDQREALMAALNTAFLDREILATTPHNSRVRFTVPGASPLILEMRFVAHLEQFCTVGADEAPAQLDELLVALEELGEEQAQTGAAYVVGLASPTGWEAAALDAIRNAGTGLAYHNPHVRVFLIDLTTGAVVFDELDPETLKFAGLFRLSTSTEDRATLADQLRAELAARSGLILSDFATERGASLELVLDAAHTVEAEGRHRLLKDNSVGWMLVNV